MVADGTIVAPGDRHTTYWDVTTDAMLRREATAKLKPKTAADFKLIGQSLARRDIPPKFTGGAAYLQDLRLPGMVHARIGRPPVPRAELISLDASALKAVPGVIEVVRDGSFVAVVCEREEEAIKARVALRELAVWKSARAAADASGRLRSPQSGTADAGLRGVRKNGAERADCREADRGAVHSSVSAARLHRPVVRRGAQRGEQADGLDP